MANDKRDAEFFAEQTNAASDRLLQVTNENRELRDRLADLERDYAVLREQIIGQEQGAPPKVQPYSHPDCTFNVSEGGVMNEKERKREAAVNKALSLWNIPRMYGATLYDRETLVQTVREVIAAEVAGALDKVREAEERARGEFQKRLDNVNWFDPATHDGEWREGDTHVDDEGVTVVKASASCIYCQHKPADHYPGWSARGGSKGG